MVFRSQPSAPDVKTACERRKRKSFRKALVKFDELTMLMTIEKPLVLMGEVNADITMLDLVDRSDEERADRNRSPSTIARTGPFC